MLSTPKAAFVTAAAGALVAGILLIGSGPASAAGVGCGDAQPAVTNGNPVNDTVQQGSKVISSTGDLIVCTENTLKDTLNGTGAAADGE
ncbi:hypothetical protein AF335_04120 [Streptomyces eurocidicus]|uniref:Secreted protein n=1 Tax=Streptomyces eurocidicus TaxID=66423 RepID=A0A2N8P3B7_STREU|nr:hypothetical protein [Streptomyces eurocidicus]MBB5117710.1 hypothetical protein [Streptomyces eurocidicus]MBF6053545.1 hypothetical protein [Streptomyces eurocidicus]PNE35506.1 hypothetical protein AF335_04120 [Streptomyces eurocidicus]